MRELGQKVLVINSKEEVDTLYDVTREEMNKNEQRRGL
jgi:hypothetical protein